MKNVGQYIAAAVIGVAVVAGIGSTVSTLSAPPVSDQQHVALYTQTALPAPNPYAAYEPDPLKSPGAVDPALTQDVIAAPGFTTKAERSVSEATKKKVFLEYGITSGFNHYEVDHIISVVCGGSEDIKNLWPEPFAEPWGAHTKDRLEAEFGRRIKSRKMKLADAQYKLSHDWVQAYIDLFGNPYAKQ